MAELQLVNHFEAAIKVKNGIIRTFCIDHSKETGSLTNLFHDQMVENKGVYPRPKLMPPV